MTSSDRTRNIKAKTIYKNMIKVANESCPNAAGRNYSGTMQFDISGHVTNYKSYELANTMGRGAAFIWDNCCRGLAAHEVPDCGCSRKQILMESYRVWKLGILMELILLGIRC